MRGTAAWVMIVKIVLGIGIVNGLIMKRFLFYRLWIPKRSRTCEGKLGTCNSRCFVGSELHDDAIVLKIGRMLFVHSSFGCAKCYRPTLRSRPRT